MGYDVIARSQINPNSDAVRIVANVIINGKPRTLTIAKVIDGRLITNIQDIPLTLLSKFMNDLFLRYISNRLSKKISILISEKNTNIQLLKRIAITGNILL